MADLNAAVANLNNRMDELLAAIGPLLTANAPGAATFATTPGTHAAADIIDYKSKTGMELYKQGISSLYGNDDKFTLENAKAPGFIREVKARVENMGWNNIDQGIVTYQVDGDDIDLIENYGLISMQEIQDQSKPWYEHDGAKATSRAAQNNTLMFEMLMNSITPGAKNQVSVYKDEYMLSNGANPPKLVGNAAALYKVIMRLTTLDTKSTNKALRDTLKDLPTLASTLQGDIDAIHNLFNDTYSQLKARGEDVDDKEDILFKAYANVPDGKFQAYMEKKEGEWYEDASDMQGKDWKDIMKMAKAKFDLLKGDSRYTWGTLSPAEQQVIALQAQLADLKSSNLQISKKLKDKLKDKKEEKKDGAKKKNKKDTSNKKKQKKDEEWKKVPPKAGEAMVKTYNDKKWNWCEHHQAWCIHTPDECEVGKKLKASTTVANQAQVDDASSTTAPNSSYAALLAHLASQDTE